MASLRPLTLKTKLFENQPTKRSLNRHQTAYVYVARDGRFFAPSYDISSNARGAWAGQWKLRVTLFESPPPFFFIFFKKSRAQSKKNTTTGLGSIIVLSTYICVGGVCLCNCRRYIHTKFNDGIKSNLNKCCKFFFWGGGYFLDCFWGKALTRSEPQSAAILRSSD